MNLFSKIYSPNKIFFSISSLYVIWQLTEDKRHQIVLSSLFVGPLHVITTVHLCSYKYAIVVKQLTKIHTHNECGMTRVIMIEQIFTEFAINIYISGRYKCSSNILHLLRWTNQIQLSRKTMFWRLIN